MSVSHENWNKLWKTNSPNAWHVLKLLSSTAVFVLHCTSQTCECLEERTAFVLFNTGTAFSLPPAKQYLSSYDVL